MILGLLGSFAVAQDEPPEEDIEVIVYGELLVAQAHQAVIEELKALGYDNNVLRRGDHVVYRHASPWLGEVALYDDGWMQVKRQPLRVEGREVPWASQDSPVAWAGCLIYPWACLRVNGAFVGQRRWRGAETRTVDHVQPKVQTWGDRIADLAVDRRIDGLPDALQALWDQGRPLQGTHTLSTYRERRQALLEYLSTRTDTAWGAQVRQAVEAFCRAVVQTSDHPFSEAELEAYSVLLTP